MSQLIALIVAIALGAIVTAIGYVLLGESFAKQSVKAEAQKILVQAEQIEVAMIAYKVDNGGVIRLGESVDASNNILEINQIFKYLVDGGYLKEDINKTLESGTLGWHYVETKDVDGNVTSSSIQRVVEAVDQCIEANHQKNGYPVDGLVGGEVTAGNFVIQAGDLSEGVPICESDSAAGAACCVVAP